MTPDKSLKVLSKIWGNRSGYIFLPWIDGKCKSAEQRRRAYHEGRAFYWPKEKDAVLQHMEEHTNDDLYFCPNLFDGKRRNYQFAREERAIWADLDEVDPTQVEEELRPTIAWESSPGRFQGVWLLTADALLASEAGGLGQRMTYHIGADRGGWDATQLLRPPGWNNHKPEYKEIYGDEGAPGSLLWDKGPRYHPADLEDELPRITATYESEDVIEQELEAVDRRKVLARVKMKLSRKVKDLLDPKAEVGRSDRSETAFFIETSLAEVGCTLSEIVAIIRPTVWNKYTGRQDELKRLKVEAAKAIEKARQSREEEDEEGSDFEVAEEGPAELLYTMVAEAPEPEWLVDEIWTQGACGIIAGGPKSFKSFISLDMAFSIATGSLFLGKYRVKDPGPVLYIQEEDSLPTIGKRLGEIAQGRAPEYHPHSVLQIIEGVSGKKQLMWGPPQMPPIYAKVRRGLILSEPEWQEWLDEELSKREYKALMLDPMMMLVGDIEENRYADMTNRFFRPLKQLAEKYQVAIVLIHHTKKAGHMGRRGTALLGSQAAHAWTEDMLHVDKPNDKTSKLTILRESKFAEALWFKLQPTVHHGVWDPTFIVDTTASTGEPREESAGLNEGLKEAHGRAKAERTARLGDAINSTHKALTELGEGAHRVEVIAEAAGGIKPGTVRSQLSKLKKDGLVQSDGAGLWSLAGD